MGVFNYPVHGATEKDAPNFADASFCFANPVILQRFDKQMKKGKDCPFLLQHKNRVTSTILKVSKSKNPAAKVLNSPSSKPHVEVKDKYYLTSQT